MSHGCHWCCCSLGEVTYALCADKMKVCSRRCCGPQSLAVVALVVRIVVRELVAASGAFLVVWYCTGYFRPHLGAIGASAEMRTIVTDVP